MTTPHAPPFRPSGVITLTTDFGHKGPFVASMKGVMLTRFPGVQIVDLTHEIMVHWPAEAGFWLERSYRFFPTGTVHLAVVDPGTGTGREIIAAEYDGHVFLAPDNGLLAPLLANAPSGTIHQIDLSRLPWLDLSKIAATFHGRDIFAPLAAELAAGRTRVHELGPMTTDIIPSWIDDPSVTPYEVIGTVITVDHFGNLITNIQAHLLDAFSRPVVRVAGQPVPFGRTYGEVKPGDYLALINSFGVLEIARAEQNAADALGVERGAPVSVTQA